MVGLDPQLSNFSIPYILALSSLCHQGKPAFFQPVTTRCLAFAARCKFRSTEQMAVQGYVTLKPTFFAMQEVPADFQSDLSR